MESWTTVADLLWRNAIAVIPLAILVGLLCRCLPSRPSTRHTMWLVVLLWFVVPVLLPGLQPPDWLASAASGSNRHATSTTVVTTPLSGPNDESRSSDDSLSISIARADSSPSAIGKGNSPPRNSRSVRALPRTRRGRDAFRRSTAGTEPGRYAFELRRLLRWTARLATPR